MADTTVKQLAQLIDRSVETLVAQMQEAGLSRRGPDDLVTDAEKQQLLAHLKRAHGATDAQQQISLKRKTVSTIKTTPAVGGKAKTVSVEVRKTRTFVKPSDEAAAQEAARKAEEEAARLAAEEAARQAAEEAARKAAEEAAEAARRDEESGVSDETGRKPADGARDKKLTVIKPAAAVSRKAESPEAKAQREAEEARRKAADEARKAQEAAARKAAEEKARQLTLEQAQRIAAELAARQDEGGSAADVPLARGLVGKAYEDSFAKEDREIPSRRQQHPRQVQGRQEARRRAEFPSGPQPCAQLGALQAARL